MNNKIVLKFEYDNICYYVEKDNNLLRCYYNKDGKKNYSLTKKQLSILNSVINTIKPSKDYLKITKYKYNNTVYDIILDKKTNLYLFYPIPKREDLIKLNYIFNNQEDYVSVNNNKLPNKQNSFFKRITKIFNKKVIIYIECSFIIFELAVLGDHYKEKEHDDNTYYEVVEKYYDTDDSYLKDIIVNSINENPNIKDEEKKALLSFVDIIVDNKAFINLEVVNDRLKTLRFEYVLEQNSENGIATDGAYYPDENKIVFYEASNISEVEQNVVNHEICHVFTVRGLLGGNTFLVETVNTIFNSDVTGIEDVNLYTRYLDYTKALMEIIGVEPFKKYKGISDITIIIDAISEITNDRDGAMRFLNTLDIYKKVYEQYIRDLDNEELKENKKNLENELYEYFCELYRAKYNTEMYNDILMMYYLNRQSFNIIADELFNAYENPCVFRATKKYFAENENDTVIKCIYYNIFTDEYGEELFTIGNDERYLPEDFALG